jgi:hypothetical protein
LLSELMLLGAVYNRFRLGQPATKGLIASPADESREAERPVDVIKRRKAMASRDGRPPVTNKKRSIFQRAALGLFVGTAVAGRVIRRRTTRGRHSVS